MYRNILVPVSFDEDAKTQAAINTAKVLGDPNGRITLLHVIEQVPSYAISYVPKDFLAEAHKAVANEIHRLADTLPNATGLVVDGHSGRTILSWADEHEVDCIIIASHRPGMQDLLIGSTATHVVRHAKCAVHVLR